MSGTWHKRLFAWALAHCNGRYERFIAQRKRALFAGLHGTVMEIGPGTGPNLALYPAAIRWIGVEPNRYMHQYLLDEARRLGIVVELLDTDLEGAPVADGSLDAVVGTLVLCSIDEPETALKKILRALKPGGRFIFIEHVAAPRGTLRRAVQGWLRPAWKAVFDGCRPDRETRALLEAAGFAQVTCEAFEAPLPIVSGHIAGWAVK